MLTQDCIPVGCVPPARWPYLGGDTCLVPGGGTCLSRGGVPAWSRGVYLPGPRGGVPAWSGGGGGYLPGPGGVYLVRHSPPCGQNSWHTLLKILPCPQTSFAGGKKDGPLTEFLDPLKIHHMYVLWSNTKLQWSRENSNCFVIFRKEATSTSQIKRLFYTHTEGSVEVTGSGGRRLNWLWFVVIIRLEHPLEPALQ